MLSLCLHLSSFNLCLLITAVVVINFDLDFFTYSVLAYFHSLGNLLIGGLNVHRCFTHYLNIQLVSEHVHLLWFNYVSEILDPD